MPTALTRIKNITNVTRCKTVQYTTPPYISSHIKCILCCSPSWHIFSAESTTGSYEEISGSDCSALYLYLRNAMYSPLQHTLRWVTVVFPNLSFETEMSCISVIPGIAVYFCSRAVLQCCISRDVKTRLVAYCWVIWWSISMDNTSEL